MVGWRPNVKQNMARSGVNPQEATYVDDRLPNITGARRIGMQAIHHVETQHTIVLGHLC